MHCMDSKPAGTGMGMYMIWTVLPADLFLTPGYVFQDVSLLG